MNKRIITSLTLVTTLVLLIVIQGCSTNDPALKDSTLQLTEKENVIDEEPTINDYEDAVIREFDMESYNSEVDGKYAPRFSLDEIEVNAGEIVKININTTSGTHDFKIDELQVFAETPEGEITTVEFQANTPGTYIYYCSKGKHRELGQWGKLIVNSVEPGNTK